MKKVLGIDLEPGSPAGLKGRYAITLVGERGEVLLSKRSVPLRKLLRILWEYKPDAVALDNVYELGSDAKELLRILSLFPPEVEVVQVTKGEGKKLKVLAREAGLNVPPGKLDPSHTSYLAAMLALMGYGLRVKAFESKTKIIVTKGRTPRAGGSSMDRFKRSVRNSVMETVREIRELLEEHGFDYDVVIRQSDGGIASATFTVYAPREELSGIIKPRETDAVRVILRPVALKKIYFEGVEEFQNKYLIVGYDPGIESAIVLMDLKGKVIYAESSKNLDRGDIVNIINRFGTALLVATDKNPPPESVKKLASTLGAQLYVPPHSLSVQEKEEIGKKFKGRIKNPHIRDALAAAYKAFSELSSKLSQIDAYLSRIDLEIDEEKVKADVIRGKTVAEAIESELERLLEEDLEKEEVRKVKKKRKNQSSKDSRITRLEAENEYLRKRVKELERELERVKEELDSRHTIPEGVRVRALKEVIRSLSIELRAKDEEIQKLHEEINELMEIIKLLSKNEGLLALKVKTLDKSKINLIEKMKREYGIHAIIAEELGEGAEDLGLTYPIVFDSEDLPTLPKELVIFEGSNFGVVSPNVMEVWEERKKVWRRKKNGLTAEDLKELFEEYRSSRLEI